MRPLSYAVFLLSLSSSLQAAVATGDITPLVGPLSGTYKVELVLRNCPTASPVLTATGSPVASQVSVVPGQDGHFSVSAIANDIISCASLAGRTYYSMRISKGGATLYDKNIYLDGIGFNITTSLPFDITRLTSAAGNSASSSTNVNSGGPTTGNAIVTIPTKISDLTNDRNYVDAAGARTAAPVQSVNGQTGAVVINTGSGAPGTPGLVKSNGSALVPAAAGVDFQAPIATNTYAPYNASGYTTPTQAAAAAPVQSVNGQTGLVVISTGASAPATAGVVKSNGTTLIAAVAGSDYQAPIAANTYAPYNASGYTTPSQAAAASPVQSVNGQTGAVTIATGTGAPATVGVVKSNGSALVPAVSGTDFQAPLGVNAYAPYNASGYTTPTQAAAAAPVQSVNGQTGSVVTITAPAAGIVKSNGSALSAAVAGTDYQAPISANTYAVYNAAGYTTPAQAASAAPVQSVNGQTGAIVTVTAPAAGLVKSSGTALSTAVAGTDYQAPIAANTYAAYNAAGYTTPTQAAAAAPVQSVNGQTGVVSIATSGPTAIASKTASYTATTSDYILLGNTTSALTFTLPATPTSGQTLIIENVNTNTLTIATNGKSVNGSTSNILVNGKYALLTFYYDGTAWYTAGGNTRDVISVKDFGARGDGTTNDTAAIQTALNFCGATLTQTDLYDVGGRVCYFPSGTYSITSTLEVQAPVEMDPTAMVQVANSVAVGALTAVFRVGSTSQVHGGWFRGGKIDINRRATDGIYFRNYQHMRIENITVMNVYTNGFHFCDATLTTQCFEAVVRGLKVVSTTATDRPLGTKWWANGSAGMRVEEPATDNYFSESVFTQTNIGVLNYSGGNYFSKLHAYAYPDSGMVTGYDDYGNGNYWLQVEADSHSTYGFRIRGYNDYLSECIVFNNAGVSDNVLTGIYFDQQYTDSVVVNCSFNGSDGSSRLKTDISGSAAFLTTADYQVTAFGNKSNNIVANLWPAGEVIHPGTIRTTGLKLNGGVTMTNTPDLTVTLGTVVPGATGGGTYVFKPQKNVTLTAIDWQVTTNGVGCSTLAQIAAYSGGTITALVTNITNAAANGTGTGSVSVAAGAVISIRTSVASAGCSTVPGTIYPILHYSMQ